MFGLYFHFPFCLQKCHYCAFYSKAERHIDLSRWDSFYQKKLDEWENALGHSLQPTTVYFGGGTPSLLPVSVIEAILRRFDLKGVEVTVEANPEAIDEDKMLAFRDAGVNRLSLGIQSLDDEALRFMGRIHTADRALRMLFSAQKVFNSISVDLIYGRPRQTLTSWEKELRQALSFGLKHMSLYQLTIENGWRVVLPDDDTLADFYELTNAIMKDAGVPRYEVSNYAASTADESRHNLTYWLGGDFLGIGPKAHSRIGLHEIANDENGDVAIDNKLSTSQRDTEIFLTSIRTRYGVDPRYGYLTSRDKINTMVENGFVAVGNDGHIIATDKGFPVLDSVSSFLLG